MSSNEEFQLKSPEHLTGDWNFELSLSLLHDTWVYLIGIIRWCLYGIDRIGEEYQVSGGNLNLN